VRERRPKGAKSPNDRAQPPDSLRRALAQEGKVLALERAHLVLFAAGALVADAEVVGDMGAEVEGVGVADGNAVGRRAHAGRMKWPSPAWRGESGLARERR
jgi:hypothetical protein